MAKRVAVTEKMRKELSKRIAELTPYCRWHVIARDERKSVEWAFLRIDKDDKAEVFSDDGVSGMIYEHSIGRKLIAERTIQWLEENNLWMGARFTLPEEEEEELNGADQEQGN